MNTIKFKEGFKQFSINGDPDRVIRFDPSDIAIVERINEAHKAISALDPKTFAENVEGDSAMEQAAGAVKSMRETVYAQIDHIFGYSVCSIIFGKTFSLEGVKNFLIAVNPIITREIEAYQKENAAKVDKYIVKGKGKKS